MLFFFFFSFLPLEEELLAQNNLNKKPADKNEWPWLAAIFKLDSQRKGNFFCGASLISEEHILTSAHCVERFAQKGIFKKE